MATGQPTVSTVREVQQGRGAWFTVYVGYMSHESEDDYKEKELEVYTDDQDRAVDLVRTMCRNDADVNTLVWIEGWPSLENKS